MFENWVWVCVLDVIWFGKENNTKQIILNYIFYKFLLLIFIFSYLDYYIQCNVSTLIKIIIELAERTKNKN